MQSKGAIEKLKEQEKQNRQRIEKLLATSKKGLSIADIESETALTWQTIKRHLDKLQAIGRVHSDRYGNTQVFFWNGVEKDSEKIKFGSHTLFLDCMISPWGKPFIRIKDTKKSDSEWKDMGAIIVDSESITELIQKLDTMKKHIKKYE